MNTKDELEYLDAACLADRDAYYDARNACRAASNDLYDDENKDNKIKNENKLKELQHARDSAWLAYSNSSDARRGK